MARWPRMTSRAARLATTARSVDAEDIDDEDERVGALDLGLRHAALAVALVRRDRQQQTRADLLADEAFVPAGDHGADADREADRGAAVIGVVEDATAPGLSQVVHHEVVADLHEVAVALAQHDGHELGGRPAGREL